MSSERQILIVEDEPLIAMMLEDFLIEIGHAVTATCESLDEAIQAVEAGGFDLAICDVNLRDEAIWPVAALLRDKGVPFILATGGHVDPPPAEFAAVPVMQKPYTIERVGAIIDEALAAA